MFVETRNIYLLESKYKNSLFFNTQRLIILLSIASFGDTFFALEGHFISTNPSSSISPSGEVASRIVRYQQIIPMV